MPVSFLLLVLIFEITAKSVHGWGIEGHALVVHLAESQLTIDASEWIKPLLPWFVSGNLTAVASWPDDIIHENSNHFDYRNWNWSRPLHYIDLPDWNCNYDRERDCKNDSCIDGALRNYSQRVIAADLDRVQHQEALMFLVHFAGDVHQPLHVSFEGDLGGNKVKGFFMNSTRETNLHSLWDSGLIHIRMSRDFKSNITIYYEYLYDLMRNQTPTNDDGDFKQWIAESVKLVCEQVYIDEKNITMNASATFHLGNVYYEKNIPVIEKRIIQGGQRLGTLLNMLASKRPKPSTSSSSSITPTSTSSTTFIASTTSTTMPSSSSRKLYWSTTTLIVILSIEFVIVIAFVGIRMFMRRKQPVTLSFSTRFTK
ncbi:unnamed protein product [Rotaria sp. Silwood1]|nr:unnamed protein product [Rotaria sp. Silwood1]